MKKQELIKVIRHLIKESFENLNEAQMKREVESDINNELTRLQLDILGNFPYSDIIVFKEVKDKVIAKLNKLKSSNFEYKNFYIVKLGNFLIKDENKETEVTFKSADDEIKKYSFCYAYVYQDTIIYFRFGSNFFETDSKLLEQAEEYCKNNKINLDVKSEKGEIIINDDFNTTNLIIINNESRSKTFEKKLEPRLAKERSDYRVGTKVNHPQFGKGTIKKTEKYGIADDGSIQYKVTIDFEDKTRTLLMKSTKKVIIEPGVLYNIVGGPFKGAQGYGVDENNVEVKMFNRVVKVNKNETELKLEPTK